MSKRYGFPMGGHSSDLGFSNTSNFDRYYYGDRNRSLAKLGRGTLITLVVVALVVGFVGLEKWLGVGGWGPKMTYGHATVQRMWVDTRQRRRRGPQQPLYGGDRSRGV
jgi:hypothetical protein